MSEDNKNRLLIVDAHPMNASILADILTDSYALLLADTGAEALALARSESPDLILMDMGLPDMDGAKVCKHLKEESSTWEIPVIFIITRDGRGDEARGLEAGGVDCRSLPVNPKSLLVRVKTHLKLRELQGKLDRQKRELKKAARLREVMARITRDDLKHPLAEMFSGLDHLYGAQEISPEQAQALDRIRESAHELLELIHSSLDLFKMEQGIYRVIPSTVDLLDILAWVRRDLRPQFQSKRGKLKIQVNGRPHKKSDRCPAQGETLLFYSMLSNLIENAVEASPPGKNVGVDFVKKTSQLLIKIHNHGSVPRIIQPRFFDKYSTSGKPNGTGLGTYTARLIARNLNGDITMASSRKRGTLVSICLGDCIKESPLSLKKIVSQSL